MAVRDGERRRLRRDLHDALGPMLAGMALQLETAADLTASDPEAARALLGRLRAETGAAISELRAIVDDRRPVRLDQLGLVGALRVQAARLAGDLEVTIEAPDELPPLPADVEVAAYRIAQEALANVIRHAGARRCVIRLAANGGLDLSVMDDGTGLPRAARAGIGIPSMRERAAELGGTCALVSGANGGTVVRARLPVHLLEGSGR